MVKLWLLVRDELIDYDTYDSAVVAAETEDLARHTRIDKYHDWTTHIDELKVRLLGEAIAGTMAGVICASFNAG